MKKRILSLALTILLCLSLMPTGALAGGDMGKAEHFNTVSLGAYHGAAITTDGDLYTWGSNSTISSVYEGGKFVASLSFCGQLGLGNIEQQYITTPTKVPGLSNVVAVSLGRFHSAAITANGDLYTWGSNFNGELGLGNKGEGTHRSIPTKVPGLSNVVAVSLGSTLEIFGGCSAAITANGDLYTWGGNWFGQLGLTDSADKTRPTKVQELSNVVAVSLGERHSAAITANGDLYTWGLNTDAQLGFSSPSLEYLVALPTKVPGLTNVVAVSLGWNHSAAITENGDLYTWGSNNNCQLGHDNTVLDEWMMPVAPPTKVPGLSNVVAVSLGGSSHSAAITASGDLYTWGADDKGSLGLGIIDGYVREPTRVSKLSNVAAVCLGWKHSAAITANGDLYTWGGGVYNYGQLGVGDTEYRNTPTYVMSGVKLPSTSTPTPPPSVSTATPTASTVLVNGKNVSFDAYNIVGNNYFKLRDLAYILSGTQKQFEVGWDGTANAITLTSGKAYTPVGGEMTGKGSVTKTATPTSSKIFLDGKEVTFTAYNIDGNNYFKLRDIGAAFDFGVTWDGAKNTIVIDTSIGYTPE